MKEASGFASGYSFMAMALGLGALVALAIAPSASGEGSSSPRSAARQERTSQLFTMCANCHGDVGQGNPDLEAPAIASLPQWYVQAQLEKFRTGLRGTHPDDYRGLQMRPMAKQIYTDEDVVDLAVYVSELPAASLTRTVNGDKTKGATYFAACAACHGDKGQGNKALNAPPLATLDDWYIVTQLENFKANKRGYHAKDVTGAQMKPMVMTLPDSQAVRDVAAYIGTLGRP